MPFTGHHAASTMKKRLEKNRVNLTCIVGEYFDSRGLGHSFLYNPNNKTTPWTSFTKVTKQPQGSSLQCLAPNGTSKCPLRDRLRGTSDIRQTTWVTARSWIVFG